MTHIRPYLMAAFAAAGILTTAPAFAQVSGCQEGQKIITERRGLGEKLNKLSSGSKKKQIDPRAACPLFTKLVANGDAGLKWMQANKDWCQIPDQAIQNFTEEHKSIQKVKGQACEAAAKIAQMEKRAKQQAQQQGGLRDRLSGGGLTGSYSIPQGAL